MDRTSHLVLKALHRTIGPLLPPTLLSWRDARIPGRIHVDDQMLRAPTPEGLDHYTSDAASAIANLDESLRAAGLAWSDLRAVLDLPCGTAASPLPDRARGARSRHRVRPRSAGVPSVPPSSACDPLHSKPDLRDVRFPDAYDLIFVGSC
jgi:hypothetical protein